MYYSLYEQKQGNILRTSDRTGASVCHAVSVTVQLPLSALSHSGATHQTFHIQTATIYNNQWKRKFAMFTCFGQNWMCF